MLIGSRIGGFPAHDRDDGHADDALGREIAERLARDVVVVVDVEPVDGQARDRVEVAQGFGDPRTAEQFREGVGLVIVQAQRDLGGLRAILRVGERDQVAVPGTVRDDADLAAAIGDKGVQHTDAGQLHPFDVNHCPTSFADSATISGAPSRTSPTGASAGRFRRS